MKECLSLLIFFQIIYELKSYYWKEKSDENQLQEQEIIQQLSDGLRQELLAESFSVIFKQSSIFKDNFSYDTLLKCLPYIQEQRCIPDEIIYDPEFCDQDIWIYFVLQGELQVYIQSINKSTKQKTQIDSSTIQLIKKGDSFGELSFFTGVQPKMSLKSLNFSKLMKIKRSDFLKVIVEDETEYETFCMIKDMITLSKDRTKLQNQCISCGDKNHDVGNCPYLHLNPNKGKVISQTFYSQPHLNREQPKQERALKRKQKSININGNCCNCLLEYFNNKSEDLIQYEEKYLYLNSFQKYSSQFTVPVQNEIINSQQQIENYPKENSNNYNFVSFQNNNLNSSTNILSSNAQSIQNIPQLNYQLSSFLKQKSCLNKQKSFMNSVSQNKSNSSIDESEEQKDNVYENCSISPKLKQTDANNERRTSCISLQLPQQANNYMRTSSIQSQFLQENNQQIQQYNKQIQMNYANNLQKINTQSQKNDQQMSQKYLSSNYYYQQQKFNKQFSSTPCSSFNEVTRKQTNLNNNKLDFFYEQFDIFSGNFEKMKNMIKYFPHFNHKNILSKIKQKSNKQNQVRYSIQNTTFSKNFLSKTKKKQGGGLNYSQKFFDSRQQRDCFDISQNVLSQPSSSKIKTTITNSHKFFTQSIFNINSNNEKHKLQNYSSLINESKQFELSQNLDQFFTQDNNNYSFSMINPNTPTQRNLTIHPTRNRKSYDFQ